MMITSKKTILLIEDKSSPSRSISGSLIDAGYEVLIAGSVKDAIDMLRKESRISMALIDTGSEQNIAPAAAAKQILEYKTIPVLFIAEPHNQINDIMINDIPHYGFIITNPGIAVLKATIENALNLHSKHFVTIENEKYYRGLFDSSNEALFIHDRNTGIIIDVNATMLNTFGYIDKQEVVGKSAGNFSAADEGFTEEKAGSMIRKAFESGRNVFEWRSRKKSGESFWTEVILRTIKIGDEERLIASVRDISDRKAVEEVLKQTERELVAKNEELMAMNEEMEAANEELTAVNYELQAAEQRYRGVVETQTEMIARFLLDGKIIFVNRGWKKYYEEHLGFKEDVTGRNIQDLMQLKNFPQVQTYLNSLKSGELSSSMERSFVSLSGETHWQIWYIQKIDDPYTGITEFQVVGNDITARKQAEIELTAKNEELTAMYEEMEAGNEELIAINHELQAAEERYRGVVETQSEMIARFLPDGKITFINLSWKKYYENHLGIKDDITGKTIQEVVKSDSFSQIMAFLDSLTPGHTTTANERTFTSINGETLWQRWYIQKLFDPYKNIIEYQVVGTDITEQKKAEISLRESEARFKSLIDLAPDAILLGNPEGIIISANNKAAELTGYSHKELLDKNINIFFTPDEIKKVPLRYDLLKEGKVVQNERVLTRKDGSTAFIEMNTRMMPDGTYQTFVRDITERKLTEEMISAEKEKLSVTLRSIGDGVITTDIKGNVFIMNRVAEDLTGWSQHEAEGRPFADVFKIINEFTRISCADPVDFVLETGKNIELSHNTVLVSRDGSERIIADSCAPIKDRNSVTIGVVLVFRDMTEKRKLIEAVQQTDKLNSLGVLAGGIAHDFNNLLSGIFGYMEIARLKSSSDHVVSGYIDKAFAVFNRARDLTQQLLTFSKGGTPVKKTGDIRILLKESSAFALSGSNVICNYEFDDSLMLCDYDENQMGQVIDNIVINAKQAMPSGGSITINAHNYFLRENENPFLNSGDYIRISITDTGSGIPPELLKKIFDPFFTTKQHGNGLGLATSYSIIQKHEGFIDVESTPQQGTTFTIILPASGRNCDSQAPDSPAAHDGRGTILIMDDEDFIREIAGDLLSHMGYSIIYAKNGAEAIRLFNEAGNSGNIIDAAIFDLTIPGGMGGREAVAEIRKNHPGIPIFASSGFSEDHIMSHPGQYGFTASIRKPYRKDEMAELLNRYLV